MQGETDAADRKHAGAYAANLVHFVACLRKDLAGPRMHVVLGRIGPPPPAGYRYQSMVRDAQVSVAADDERTWWADTDDLARDTDHIRLLAEGVVSLGERRARARLQAGWSPQESTAPELPYRKIH